MIEVEEARRRLLEAVRPLPSVEIDLTQAIGRVLAAEIAADRDFPATDRSAMDGFAVRSADLPAPGLTLRVAGEIPAGVSAESFRLDPGEALRIFTGAPIPAAADAVVMVELTVEDRGAGTVLIRERPEAGQNIRRRGEDLVAGETVVRSGAVIHAPEVAALTSVGVLRPRVVGAPRIAILATGDELVPPDRVPAPHQIRNSNAPMLAAQLLDLGLAAREIGIAADDDARLDRALADGLAADVLLVTGGVSVGAYDLVGAALRRAGLELLFHGVAMKPGKPILAGRCGTTLVAGLPGNPVSTFTAFHVLVAPALRKMMGHEDPGPWSLRASLGARLRRRSGRTTFALASVSLEKGHPVVRPVRTMSSGDVVSLARANAFVVAPGAAHALEAGTEVDVLPWRDFDRRGC